MADIREAAALIEGIKTQSVVADKGYDANAFIATTKHRAPKRSSLRAATAWLSVPMIVTSTKTAISSNASSIGSNNSGASPHDTKNSL